MNLRFHTQRVPTLFCGLGCMFLVLALWFVAVIGHALEAW